MNFFEKVPNICFYSGVSKFFYIIYIMIGPWLNSNGAKKKTTLWPNYGIKLSTTQLHPGLQNLVTALVLFKVADYNMVSPIMWLSWCRMHNSTFTGLNYMQTAHKKYV